MKRIIVFVLLFSFCSEATIEQENEVELVESTTSTNQVEESNDTTTTAIEVEQLETFIDIIYEVDSENSAVSYLAPKDFLNSKIEIVRGSTNKIVGGFTLSLDSCDLADSCLLITDLIISTDLTTLKSGNSIRDNAIKKNWLESNLFPSAIYKIDELILPNNDFDSKIDETVVGILSIRNIEVNIPFTITAYMDDDQIKIYGITEIDTTWFGFDAPTKFNAWEVLNPIGIEVELVAKRK
jgi:hypothetical protein|tara:strand:- start:590 stop:1306 length:717 start_codon:yes stop_codon:yes gene_type:complete